MRHDDIDPAVLERARRSMADIKSGRVKAVPADEVLDMLSALHSGSDSGTAPEDARRSEVRRRMTLIQAGDVEWIDEDEVLAELETDP